MAVVTAVRADRYDNVRIVELRTVLVSALPKVCELVTIRKSDEQRILIEEMQEV